MRLLRIVSWAVVKLDSAILWSFHKIALDRLPDNERQVVALEALEALTKGADHE